MRKPIEAWLLYWNCTEEQFTQLLTEVQHDVLDDGSIRLWNRARTHIKRRLRVMQAA